MEHRDALAQRVELGVLGLDQLLSLAELGTEVPRSATHPTTKARSPRLGLGKLDDEVRAELELGDVERDGRALPRERRPPPPALLRRTGELSGTAGKRCTRSSPTMTSTGASADTSGSPMNLPLSSKRSGAAHAKRSSSKVAPSLAIVPRSRSKSRPAFRPLRLRDQLNGTQIVSNVHCVNSQRSTQMRCDQDILTRRTLRVRWIHAPLVQRAQRARAVSAGPTLRCCRGMHAGPRGMPGRHMGGRRRAQGDRERD